MTTYMHLGNDRYSSTISFSRPHETHLLSKQRTTQTAERQPLKTGEGQGGGP